MVYINNINKYNDTYLDTLYLKLKKYKYIYKFFLVKNIQNGGNNTKDIIILKKKYKKIKKKINNLENYYLINGGIGNSIKTNFINKNIKIRSISYYYKNIGKKANIN